MFAAGRKAADVEAAAGGDANERTVDGEFCASAGAAEHMAEFEGESSVVTQLAKDITLRKEEETDGGNNIFHFDREGDRDNRFFGLTYAHEMPRYELATRRNLYSGAWISHARPKYVNDKASEKQEDNSSDRYFSQHARKMERDGRQKRLYLAYSEKRLSRAAANNAEGQSDEAAPISAGVNRPHEMDFIPLDPVVDVKELTGNSIDGEHGHIPTSSDDRTGVLLTDGQSVEQYLVNRSKRLNAAVAANPHDVGAWLDLIAFQEQTMRLHKTTKRMSSSMKASVRDKQEAILARALINNPHSRELHRVKLNMSLQSQASGENANVDSYQRQIKDLLSEDFTNGDLWLKLLQSRQQHFGSFSMQSVRDLYARILTVLRSEVENAVKEAQSMTKVSIPMPGLSARPEVDSLTTRVEKVSKLLLDFHFRMCIFEKKAGYTERSIAQLQALLDFTMNDQFKNVDSNNNVTHLDMLRKFESRWNEKNKVGFGDELWGSCELSMDKLEMEPPQLPYQDFEEYVKKNCVTTLDQINPAEVIRTEEHKRSLLSASARYQRRSTMKSGVKSSDRIERNGDFGRSTDSDPSGDSDSDADAGRGGKLIYSNLHGYRIAIDDANDTGEYERILSELRGSESARSRQLQLLEKEKVKHAALQAAKSQAEDQRARYTAIEANDRFVAWLVREEMLSQLQWAPLRSNNPHHQNLIEEQPDRATLTEELQPFLFSVPKSLQWRLIDELLQINGVTLCGDSSKEGRLTDCMAMYADDTVDCEIFVAPILSALTCQPGHSTKHKLFLDPCERKMLLKSKLLDDIIVVHSVLRDPTKVAFVRRVFAQGLEVFHDDDIGQKLKCLWIGFEAEVARSINDNEEILAYARCLSQHLAKKATASDTDYEVLFAYAKLELKVGNERQVGRICEKTLTSLGLPVPNDVTATRNFHRFVFLRARLEVWPMQLAQNKSKLTLTLDQKRFRVLRCLYTLWYVWQVDGDQAQTLDVITKRHPKQTYSYLQEKLTSNWSTKANLLSRYRAELDSAIRYCAEATSGECHNHVSSKTSYHRPQCWAGYCLHNLALVVYAYEGFEAACNEYRQALTNAKHQTCSKVTWMWFCFLEFMQQHQASGMFPTVTPRAWRTSVSEAVDKFPNNVLFLRLFVDSETGNTISQVLRSHFFRVEKRWRRHFDSPKLVEWLFALLCELCRVERAAAVKESSDIPNANTTAVISCRPTCCLYHRWGMNEAAVNRIRLTFERMVNHIRTKGTALCWRLYMNFEVALGKVDAAKKVLYRGIASCAWSKSLYMDGLRLLRPYLSETECQELLELMEAKELSIRADYDFLTYAFCFLGMDNLGLFAEHPAVTNGSGWTITDILNQTLPEHRTLSEAKLLLEPLLADHKHKRCRNYRVGVQLKGSVVAESQVDIPRKHHVGALPSIQKLSIPTTCSGFRGHALSVWEDKYRMRCLEVEDVLFLIAHPHVATTLESASFLRRAQLTFDQIMELEMTLAMLRQQKGWNNVKPLLENAQASAPLCIKLARNAWAHGRAFKSLQSRKIVLPEVTVCKGIPPRFTKLGLTKPANVSQLYTLPHNHEKSLSLKEHVTTRRSAGSAYEFNVHTLLMLT
ncbi:unnamed protein product [Phytophthora lilii]|uniref:Unnamed protein product n=1 Tax=Phytophthora lilii TaxID=2077276 RepID=A0A9W6TA87_9STRA|nr:unnamed protein product [Phytophthora lilii]